MTAPLQDAYQVSAITRYLRELLQGNRHLTDIWIEGDLHYHGLRGRVAILDGSGYGA